MATISTHGAQYPMTGFIDYLSKSGLGATSQKQVLGSIRRVLKHLGPDGLVDRSEMAIYRLSLPEATNRIFVYAWAKFQGYMETQDEHLPDLPSIMGTKIVHPLWADLTDLTSVLNIHLIEKTRWIEVKDAGPEVYEPARRSFEFIAGRPPLDSDWLIPRNTDAAEPMPYWMIDTIMRTNATEGSLDVEKAAFQMLENVTRRGIGATDLRVLWDLVVSNRDTPRGRRKIMRAAREPEDTTKPWSPLDQERAVTTLRAIVAE